MRVCVDARLVSGTAGGVESVVIGMANALSSLDHQEDEYLFLALPGHDEWLKPHISGRCRIIFAKSAVEIPDWRAWLNKNVPIVRRLYHKFHFEPVQGTVVPASDGAIEEAGAEVMHFTHQLAFTTSVPSIYHPHDLQHVHLPEFFTPRERHLRDVRYRTLCKQASMVAVTSEWCKRDLIAHFGLPPEKIKVIVWPPVVVTYGDPTESDLNAVRRKFRLPDGFILYPAQTFRHKNHIGLLNALALLRDRSGIKIPFVASGGQNEFYSTIRAHVEKLSLNDQVSFIGFVSPSELQCLYRLCRFVVVPTMFEAASGPVGEAFSLGKAVACSAITSLPEQAGDAAVLFDPADVDAIADAVKRLWEDHTLRATLERRGKDRLAGLSWEETGRIFRAHYRRIADKQLTAEEIDLISATPKY